MLHLSLDNILNLEKRYRASLINSVLGFKSVSLIGTSSVDRKTNLAIFNSFFHLGAHPPLIGFIIRPDTVERNTLQNILETKYFTINHITEDFYQKAHQTSARYSSDTSEFDAVGLTEEYKGKFYAPFVKESLVQLGIEFKEKKELEINGTIMIIGEIKDIYLPEKIVNKDGYVDLISAGTLTNNGLDSYHKVEKINRLSYAKTDNPLNSIK
jgi:flavin reductase (DIM6/NTAB) family NADH-FMN oxidoreductase RutF